MILAGSNSDAHPTLKKNQKNPKNTATLSKQMGHEEENRMELIETEWIKRRREGGEEISLE